jgi:tetratricopeptide (TPR) repeat protein
MSKRKTTTTPESKIKEKPALPHVQEAFSTKWKLLIGAALAVLAMAVYSPSVSFDFVYDDDAVVKDNKFVKQGFGGLGKIWTTGYFKGYDENMEARAFRPVPLTTLAVEYQFFGLSPKVNHISNLLMYGLTAVFLFLLLTKLLRAHHPFLPVAISVLFLLHPIHSEVVANIKSRDTMLGFLNFTIAAWFLLKHLDNRKTKPLVLSLLFYTIALFSKEEVITTIAVIPLMLWFFRDFGWKKIAGATIPFVTAAAVFMLYRSFVLGGFNAGVPLTKLDNSLLAAHEFTVRSASTIFVLGHYLWKTIFPQPLISDYSYLTIPLVNWSDWRVYLSLLANLALLYIGIQGFRKRAWYGFGALYYVCTVSIFTSIITPNVSAYNDRFLYSPVLGICFLAGWALMQLVKRQGHETTTTKVFFQKNFLPVAIVSLIAATGIYKIAERLPDWKDRYVLFEKDAQQAPTNARMRKNHGGSWARKAVDSQTTDMNAARAYADSAIMELKQALAIYDDQSTGYIHLANMYIIQGQYDSAIVKLNRALYLDQNSYFARTSLVNVLYRKGDYQAALNTANNIPERLRTPNDYYLMYLIYDKLGNKEEAEKAYKKTGR